MAGQKKYNLSAEFQNFIIDNIKRRIIPNEIDRILSVFKNVSDKLPIDRVAEANLIRMISAQFDIIRFLLDCKDYRHHTEILCSISTYSNYLSDIVVRNPEYLYQIFERDYLTSQKSYSQFKEEINRGTEKYSSFNSRVNYLRRFKRRSILQIGVKDILQFENLEDTTAQLSSLAKAVLENLFLNCYRETLNKYGLKSCAQKFSMISLGKLGGNELNYSSDVDLLIIYDSNSKVGRDKSIEYFELLQEIIQLFIKSSAEITGEGFLYRIDFRLRPDGKYSPLCKSLSDTIKYYEIRGEDWERQMLIKAGFVCGSEKLFNQFCENISPFIYPSSFSISPAEQIKRMKQNIEQRIGSNENIKLSAGGIRDIEFAVQALQLINGGKNNDVRNKNSLLSIRALKQFNNLTQAESETFVNAYKVFRRIEHSLQLLNNTQTHTIPTDKIELKKLAHRMGYKSSKEFLITVKNLKNDVRKIFDQITQSDASGKSSAHGEKIYNINFEDRNRALSNLKYLQKGTGLLDYKEFDRRVIGLFNKIEPELTKYLKSSSAPDLVLENLSRIIKASSYPSIWMKQFENKQFFTNILKICEFSSRGINLLVANPILADIILTGKAFSLIAPNDLFNLTVTQLQFVLSIKFALHDIEPSQFSNMLSKYLSSIINDVFVSHSLDYNYFVAGIGSFGSGEMNFASDVDLIFVADIPEDDSLIQKLFEDALTDCIKRIKPFNCDLRLRPEGKSAQLVWDIKSYTEYLCNRGRIWEFQALLKLKFVSGNKGLFKSFRKNIADVFSRFDKYQISLGIKEMHTKKFSHNNFFNFGASSIKSSKGGIKTIEFITDYLIMTDMEIYSKCFEKSLPEKINRLKKYNSNIELLNELNEHIRFFRNLDLAIQNIFDQQKGSFPVDSNKKELTAKFLKFKSGGELENYKDQVIFKNIDWFEKIVL